MDYAYWADVVASTHFLIIVAVIAGLLISFRYRRFRPWEAGALIAIVVLWSYYGNCPLTIVEEKLRILAGKPSGITDIGFLPYYADKFFAIGISSKIIQRTTFFTGGAIFAASIEWLAPYFHFHLFSVRRTVRKLLGIKSKKRKYA
jgi:hypothetical protein